MILCIAMSVHSFFESAALAMANTASSLYLMSACIALHQPAESLALTVAFLKTNMRHWNIVLWLLAYSLTSCLGLIAGTLIKSIASDEIEGIVVALTAGTFVYVGANEIVNEEFPVQGNKREKFINLIVYILGMITMAKISGIAEQWEQHS
jgi:zinc transporter 1/2/3